MRPAFANRRPRRLFQPPRVEQLENRVVPGFLAPLSYDVGEVPISVAVGDFDGDGTPDLAVANVNSNNVSVLLGNGDGTFQPARNFPVGVRPVSVAVGDFNGDGLLDLAVANSGTDYEEDGSVSVLLGNGDGTFQPDRNFPVSGVPNSVAVGDFNGDGLLDVALVVRGEDFYYRCDNSTVRVLLSNGDGTFHYGGGFSDGGCPDSVAVGHFHDPNILDLAVANLFSGNVSVSLGNGNGTFQAARNFSAGGRWPISVAVGDFNGDGLLDLAVANNLGDNVSGLLGNGDGTFRAGRSFSAGRQPTSLAVGDFNGDGLLDLAEGNTGGGNVRVFLGNGNGTFQTAREFRAGSTVSVAVADFNGDGWPDLAVTNSYSNGVSILLNDGVWDGGWAPGGGRAPGARPRPRTPPASADFLAEQVLRLDTSVATLPPPGTTVPLVDGSRPLLGFDADQGSPRAALAGRSATQPPAPAPIGTRVGAPARALLDRLFAEPQRGWLWDCSADEPWFSGP